MLVLRQHGSGAATPPPPAANPPPKPLLASDMDAPGQARGGAWDGVTSGRDHLSMTAQYDIGSLVPTVAKVDLTFPIAVLSLDDATRLSDARLVVLIADEPYSGSGVPLTVHPLVHGEGVMAWSLDAFVDLVTRKDLGDGVDDLLDEYPAYVMCGYRTAEMVLGEGAPFIGRGILFKLRGPSSPVGRAVLLDSNDLRLVLHSGHDTVSCGCARPDASVHRRSRIADFRRWFGSEITGRNGVLPPCPVPAAELFDLDVLEARHRSTRPAGPGGPGLSGIE
jgi:hypothetical protein